MTNEDFQQRLEQFLTQSRPHLTNIRVANARRFFGGSSKPTYRADLYCREAGQDKIEHLVVRMTPDVSLVDHSSDYEALTLSLLSQRGFKVPAIAEVVKDRAALGTPFFVMEEIRGCETAPHMVLAEPYASHRVALGEQKWNLLGTLARYQLTQEELDVLPRTSTVCSWKVELDKWEDYYRANASEPEPLVDRTLRWMRANPPPPAEKLSFVHGDYRTGNFLYTADGKIRGILDWEMAHAGDPHEDIAWAICPSWGWPNANRPGFLIDKDDAFRIWENASGLRIDSTALHWWSLFATIKGVALWAASAKNVRDSGLLNSIELAACWFPRDLHLRIMAELLFGEAH